MTQTQRKSNAQFAHHPSRYKGQPVDSHRTIRAQNDQLSQEKASPTANYPNNDPPAHPPSVTSSHAIPGTILDLKRGMPKRLKYNGDSSGSGCPDQLSPARLARRGLLVEVVEMMKPGSKIAPSTMAVRNATKENFTGKFAG
ncbi:hypothetical protein C8034_v005480 [Colletotrichum sidae]|uniref:Uncharacterized protein n=1 Tax=Colletotrichum sidae TaxID=1347389 RepID=A0A4R8T644_9PEZI|nr:hypothetical protein C8034_v005480 [Colletotrichum sidae]